MKKNSNITIIQSRDIHDYKPILEELVEDFGYVYYYAILTWCGILGNDDHNYWQVYLIKQKNKVIGICGLYSQSSSTKELWLGWFGIIPSHRNKNIGQLALEWMMDNAKSIGCKKLMSYVDEDGKPLPFYYRNGFKNIGTVKKYLKSHPKLSEDDFEDMKDYVIEREL